MPALEKHAMILMIEAFVEKHGGNFSDYYIGITKKQRHAPLYTTQRKKER